MDGLAVCESCGIVEFHGHKPDCTQKISVKMSVTYKQAVLLLTEAKILLEEIDDRARTVAKARRDGKFGEGQIEFRLRLLLSKIDGVGLIVPPDQPVEDGYLFAPLPGEKR